MASARPAVSRTEDQLLAEWRYAVRQFLRFSEHAARDAGITPQQHQALLAIKGFPGRDYVSVGELAERLQVRHHSAVGLVDRLVAEDLLKRKTAREDRRRVHLVLTRRGETILAKLSAAHRRQLQRIAPRIGEVLQQLRGDAISSSPD